jgi:lipoprotein-releasing system ATP-binding protein
VNQTTNQIPSCILLREVTKTYVVESQRVEALRGINLAVPHGSLVAVTGASGSGKSTLLHVVGTLDRPTTGEVVINGTHIALMPDSILSGFRNSTVGFVFQMNNLLPEFSALENVMMPGLIAGIPKPILLEKASQLLSTVGLSAREKHRPGELSGGEQQRVAIARALLMNPPVLLCDEPTGNLDRKNSHAVQDLLITLCETQKVTMLLVTHDLDLARRLPHQVVMQDGLILEGAHA